MSFKNNLLWWLVVLLGCGSGGGESIQKKLNGINGEAIYVLNKDGSVNGVFKESYNVNDFSVLLVKDTIELGSNFTSLINVTSFKYRVNIKSPSNYVIKSDSTFTMKKYEFMPQDTGIYNFTGRIEYDSLSFPFEYKFIVVSK